MISEGTSGDNTVNSWPSHAGEKFSAALIWIINIAACPNPKVSGLNRNSNKLHK